MFILALDQGTTSSRAIVFDHAGGIVAIAQLELTQIFPEPGWVEHDPNEIFSTQIGVAVEALDRAGLSARNIAAIGITNQRETTVVWDRDTGQPIYNAIVWQDRRTTAFTEALKADGTAEMIRERTGLMPDPYFSGSKIRWLLDTIDGARPRAGAGALAFGTVDSWLVYRLTGGALHITDASNASRTMLFNIRTGDWDDDLLRVFGVPRAMLPVVRPSSEVYGQASTSLGLEGVPIAGIAGDQQAALFGQLCTADGMVKCTYGTGCFMLMNTGSRIAPSASGLLVTVAWQRDGCLAYALEGSIFIGGAVVQWLRDGLHVIESASDVEALAASVQNNGGVYLVPAFAGLGAPHWNPHARGVLCGITRGTTRGHVARAALESMAFQVADLADAMRADSGLAIPELRVDGGAAKNDLLMQIQADISGTPVVRPQNVETTALGAAYLAGRAVGFWTDDADLGRAWRLDRRFEPRMASAERDQLRRRWRRAVERAMDWVEPDSEG